MVCYDERTHRTKNYDDKRGVIYTEIMLPENAPREYADRNTLWNAVEWSETNWNAQMARKLHITFPRELSMDDNLKLIREHVQEQFVSQGMIADIAILDPASPNANPLYRRHPTYCAGSGGRYHILKHLIFASRNSEKT